MKKIIMVLTLALSVFYADAQTAEIKNVTKLGFNGLNRIDDNGYYVQYIEGQEGWKKDATKFMHLYMINNDLSIKTDFTFELKRDEKIEDVSINGESIFIITSNSRLRNRIFRILDASGQIKSEKVFEKVKYSLLKKPAIILPVENENFVVINFVKEKKVGYNISLLNNLLEEQYSSNQIPEKKKLYPVDFLMDNGKLYILEFLTPSMSDYFEYHIAVFNANSGELISKNQLRNEAENNSGFATFIKKNPQGGLITGGMYFKGNRTKNANSDGFFAAKVDTEGDFSFNTTTWKTVMESLKDESTNAFWGGKTKVFMQDLSINPDGSFVLIGENYRKGSSDLAGGKSQTTMGKVNRIAKMSGTVEDDSETALTVSEYAVFEFDKDANFVSANKFEKPFSVTIVKTDPENPPYSGQMKGLNLANILNNYGYFPYRFVASVDNQQYLISQFTFEKKKEELIGFTPLFGENHQTTTMDITSGEFKVRLAQENKAMESLGGLGRLAKKADKMDNAINQNENENQITILKSHDPYDYRAKNTVRRVVPANIGGKVLVYDFIPDAELVENGTYKYNFSRIPGVLKLTYIDIPKI